MGGTEPLQAEGQTRDEKGEERRVDGAARLMRERIGQAIQYHQQGEFERANTIYRCHLAHDPDNARVLQLHGLALQQIGDLDGATRMLSRSVALDPADAPTHCNLGNVFYLLGMFEDALRCFESAIDADPQSAEAYNDQGNVQRELGMAEDAIDSYRRAIAIDGTMAAPHFNLGNAAWDSSNVETAIECYRAAIEIDPRHAAAHNNLGNAYRTLADLTTAVQSYARAALCDPTFAMAHFNLANTHKDLGHPDAALAAYRAVLALEPENALAQHMVAALAGEPSMAAPDAFVRQVFDSYAGHFDRHLSESLGYCVPKRLRDILLDPTSTSGSCGCTGFGHVLDLGCGTGLVAEAFCNVVTHFEGVDLSPRMLAEARRKCLYETLTEGDLVAHLQYSANRDPAYDAVLAADSFIYIGDLAPVFAGVAGCLAPDGVFAFSIEATENEPFELRPTGRFAQSESYIRQLAEAHGFAVKSVAPTIIRLENGQPVHGAIFVLINARRPNPNNNT
jgi:predicted TPR repeat methyltransferase